MIAAVLLLAAAALPLAGIRGEVRSDDADEAQRPDETAYFAAVRADTPPVEMGRAA